MTDRIDQYIATYHEMADEQLVELASAPDDLIPEARAALWAELGRRGLTDEGLNAKKTEPDPSNAVATSDPYHWSLLRNEQPTMPSSEFVAVYSAQSASEAQRVQDALQNEGIQSQLETVILVPQSDAERAFQVLSEQLDRETH